MSGEAQRVQVVAFVVCGRGVREGLGVVGSEGGGEVTEGVAEAGIDGGIRAGARANVRIFIVLLESCVGEGAGVGVMLKGLGTRVVSSASKMDSGIESTGAVSLTSDCREGLLNIFRGRGKRRFSDGVVGEG